MAVITYPLSMPSAPAGFAANRWNYFGNTVLHSSPYTGSEQTVRRSGQKWSGEFILPPLPEGLAAAWEAFFVSLDGMHGSFWGYNPARRNVRGSAGGTPVVAGAGQTGRELATSGWPASQSGILLAGDYVEVDGYYYMQLVDADSNGSGAATLTLGPMLRGSPTNGAAIVTSNARVKMRLTKDNIGWDVNTARLFGFAFAAQERLP